jgi:hypothetical protein
MIQTFEKVSYTDRPLLSKIFPPAYHKNRGNLEVMVTGLKFNSRNRELFINQIDRAVLEKAPQTCLYPVFYGFIFTLSLFTISLIQTIIFKYQITWLDCVFKVLSGFIYGLFWWFFYLKKFRWIAIKYLENNKIYSAYFWIRGESGIDRTKQLFSVIREASVNNNY